MEERQGRWSVSVKQKYVNSNKFISIRGNCKVKITHEIKNHRELSVVRYCFDLKIR